MAKSKQKKETFEIALLKEDKSFTIISAAIKDDFCNYSYEILSGTGAGDTHNVKGTGQITEDLKKAFQKFNVHSACLDDAFHNSGYEIESIDDLHNDELTSLYHVDSFKIKGNKENESIILSGTKHVHTGGGRVNVESTKVLLDNFSGYKWYNELKAAADDARREVELYKEGKYIQVEPEEVVNPNQGKIDFKVVVDEFENAEVK